jgi:hypothetical protein
MVLPIGIFVPSSISAPLNNCFKTAPSASEVVYNNPERKETIDTTQETVYKIIKLKGKHHKRQREQALEMFCNLIKRKLFNWWD